jgi:hypothetical protein
VRQADQLLSVANLDDHMRRVELHHSRRTQPWDFHARELIEKAAMIGVGTALSQEARHACERQVTLQYRAVARRAAKGLPQDWHLRPIRCAARFPQAIDMVPPPSRTA